MSGTPQRRPLPQLADGTLTAIMRMDGDCGCGMTESRGECGSYRWYRQSFSSDLGTSHHESFTRFLS